MRLTLPSPAAAGDIGAPPPLWLPVAAGLPITLCMIVLGLPEMNQGHAMAYRGLYIGAYLVFCLPLAMLQRRMWQRHTALWKSVVLLLVVTYAMSCLNNVLVILAAMQWKQIPRFNANLIFRDGDWFGLIAFCAIHAVVAYYTALRHAQDRTLKAMAHAREAELRALRYQLNPHFLFNSFNAISTLVATGAYREANQMLARLSDFLRATLEAGASHEIALAHELTLTETYLDVEKARLGRRLVTRFQIGPDVMAAMVPYLLLQPLVENAIRHGIGRRTEPGRLDVVVVRSADRLSIEVGNEGLPAPTQDESFGSGAVGLSNVRERLANLYPDDHRLATEAFADGSYRVTIDLPFRPAAPLAAQGSVQ